MMKNKSGLIPLPHALLILLALTASLVGCSSLGEPQDVMVEAPTAALSFHENESETMTQTDSGTEHTTAADENTDQSGEQLEETTSVPETDITSAAPVVTTAAFPSIFGSIRPRHTPLNYDEVAGMWFPFLDYPEILKDRTEMEFRLFVRRRFGNAKGVGVNTVYVHARAFCDAYYNSALFPKGYDGGGNFRFDPLKVMVEEAHAQQLSIHAWVNPLRGMTVQQLEETSGNFPVKKWYYDAETQGKYVVTVGDRLYLNPAYAEVRALILAGVREIAENYAVDGIHIDDYFYPTTAASFDAAAFAESGAGNLSEWRIETVNVLVRDMYKTVKAINRNLLFGISPMGIVNVNYESLYADVERWCAESGYCDYIVPQIYFGFNHDTLPFAGLAEQWKKMCAGSNVKLILGIATYKTGEPDRHAGEGRSEWIDEPKTAIRQIEFTQADDAFSGYALYSYASTFEWKFRF